MDCFYNLCPQTKCYTHKAEIKLGCILINFPSYSVLINNVQNSELPLNVFFRILRDKGHKSSSSEVLKYQNDVKTNHFRTL